MPVDDLLAKAAELAQLVCRYQEKGSKTIHEIRTESYNAGRRTGWNQAMRRRANAQSDADGFTDSDGTAGADSVTDTIKGER